MLDSKSRPAALGDLVRGSRHICLMHAGDGHRKTRLGRWIEEGIETGERTLYVTEAAEARSVPPSIQAQASSWIEDGRLDLRRPESLYDVGAGPGETVELLRAEVERARRDGHSGLRITFDINHVVAGGRRRRLAEYERAIDQAVEELRILALCQYDYQELDDDLLGLAAESHAARVVTGKLLEIERSWPERMRVAGEVDMANVDQLRRELRTAGGGFGRLEVDVSELRFIDLAGLRALREAVTAPDRRSLALLYPPPHLRRLLELTETAHLFELAESREGLLPSS